MRSLVSLLIAALLINPVIVVAAESPESAAAEKAAAKKKQEFILASNTVFKPDKIIRAVKPGETITEKVVVLNDTKITLEADLQVYDMYTDVSSKIILPKQMKGMKKAVKDKLIKQPSLGANIIIPEKVIKLKPKEVKTYTITIKIPEDAKGSYYFLYTAQPLPQYNKSILEAKSDGKKNKKAALGMMMSVYSPGIIWVKGKEDLSLNVKVTNRYNPANKQLQIQSEIKNLGNGYLRAITATAVILDAAKKVVGKFELAQQGNLMVLMPNTTRRYLGALQSDLTKGDYQLVLTFQDENKKIVRSETSVIKVN